MTQTMTQTEIQTLAAIYADAIKDAVTTNDWNEIVTLNNATQDDTYDATHDYVDANHYLCAAYAELHGQEPSLDEQSMLDLSAAVDYALKTFFKKV